jgi:hypothetical protein
MKELTFHRQPFTCPFLFRSMQIGFLSDTDDRFTDVQFKAEEFQHIDPKQPNG